MNDTPRQAQVHRRTSETSVNVSLDLDGRGAYDVSTGMGFFDHMLAQLSAHSLFDLEVKAEGDLEDVAIALGQALDQALGTRVGIARMGHAYAPLDESLVRVVVDFSGRPYAVVLAEFAGARIGSMDTDLVVHFLETLAMHAKMNLHAYVLIGRNDHHIAEALFKALGRALDAAAQVDQRREGVPSTKGVL